MHLGRKTAHRKSMLANMACSLIEHKRINTTLTKAKALKQFVEPVITKSKADSTHNRRLAFRQLRNKYAVSLLFREVAQKVGDRPGGYTRIVKLGNRLGDNAEMALIELVDFNEIYTTERKEKKKTRRRAGKKTTTTNASEQAPNELNEQTENQEATASNAKDVKPEAKSKAKKPATQKEKAKDDAKEQE